MKEVEEQLEFFRLKMMNSGYNLKEREVIIKEGRRRYENLREQSFSGVRPLYRESTWNSEERDMKKKKKKLQWFGREVVTVIFVQAT